VHDRDAIAWVLDRVEREKPDVVALLGDGIEGNAASQWADAKEMNIPLKREFDSLNGFIKRLRERAPKAKRLYTAGNHCTNLMREARIDQRLRSLCDWADLKNVPEWEHWSLLKTYNYCRGRGSLWLGPQICFSHGYETTAPKINREAMYFTKNSPFSLYIHAHTHRPHEPRMVMLGDLPMDRWYANVGTLRDMNPAYMERKPKWNWGQAMIVGEVMPLKSPRMSREWDARLEVYRMYDQRYANN
jgi:hypothetical protein